LIGVRNNLDPGSDLRIGLGGNCGLESPHTPLEPRDIRKVCKRFRDQSPPSPPVYLKYVGAYEQQVRKCRGEGKVSDPWVNSKVVEYTKAMQLFKRDTVRRVLLGFIYTDILIPHDRRGLILLVQRVLKVKKE
jgi:hypothetical protein